jgi:hypothetical protein
MVLALVSIVDSITSLPEEFRTALLQKKARTQPPLQDW